jgi:hypothetical protein
VGSRLSAWCVNSSALQYSLKRNNPCLTRFLSPATSSDPDYAQLGKLKSHFPSIPVIAVTATASDRVRQDVCEILRLNTNKNSFRFFRSTANRPNLTYSVRPKPDGKDSVIAEMAEFIKERYSHGAGIVYTYSRKDADTVASVLCDYGVIAEVRASVSAQFLLRCCCYDSSARRNELSQWSDPA